MDKKEYAVYEYTEKASVEYVGSRFISSNPPKDFIIDKTIVVADNLTESDAHALCNVKKDININAYLSSIPIEFRGFTEQLLRK